jgi:hypothetical protein
MLWPQAVRLVGLTLFEWTLPLRDRVLVNRDAMLNANRAQVARLVVYLFDRVQNEPKEQQLLALAAAFLLMAEATGIPAQDAFVAVKNMMADPMRASGIFHQFDAIKYHLKNEILADG